MSHLLEIDEAQLATLGAEERAEVARNLWKIRRQIDRNPLWGVVPHSRQVEYLVATQMIVAFVGGNRSGKTFSGALDDVIQVLPEQWIPPWLLPYKRWFEPIDWRVGTVNERTTLNQVILPIYRKLIPREALMGGRWDRAYNADRRTLLLAGGSTIDFLTYQMDLDAWSGVAKHGIRLDEEPKGYAGRKIFEECMERLLSTDGDFRMSFTPLFGLSWSYHLLTAGGQPRDDEDVKVVRAHQDDNPHLSERAKRRANKLYNSEVRAARKAGLWVHFQGQVYPEWDVNVHVVPEHGPPLVTVGYDNHNHPIRKHAAVYVGIDPGRDHPFAVVWCYAHEGRLVVFDYRKRRGEGTDAKAIAEMIHSVNRGWGIKPTGYVIDPSSKRHTHETGTKSFQTLLAEHGIRARAGQNSRDAGFSRVAELLRDTPPPPRRPADAPDDWSPDMTNVRRLQVTANCSNLDDPDMPGLIEEFPMYRWKEASVQAREVGSPGKPIDLKNDALDALRYVVMMNPRELLVPAEADDPPPTNPREIHEWRQRQMRRDDIKRKLGRRKMRRNAAGTVA